MAKTEREKMLANEHCTILDCNWVTLGDDVLIAPNVQIYAAYHPTDPAVRLTGLELAAPITIGNNVWLGGGAIVCPGMTIGDNITIGADSVVTKGTRQRGGRRQPLPSDSQRLKHLQMLFYQVCQPLVLVGWSALRSPVTGKR